MTWVATQTTDAGLTASGTFTLYNAHEGLGDRPPVYTVAAGAGYVYVGLSQCWYNGDTGTYVFELATLAPGGSWEVPGETFEDGKGVFVAWIGCQWWEGEDPENRYMTAGVIRQALIRRYLGTDPTPWTVQVPWQIAMTSSRLMAKREHQPATGRDGSPVFSHETTFQHTWQLVNPASTDTFCGEAVLQQTAAWNETLQVYNPAFGPATTCGLGFYPHGASGAGDYAAFSLAWAGHDVDFSHRFKDYGAWYLDGDGATVTLQATASSVGDVGPFSIGYQRPMMIDFTGFHVRDRQGNDVNNVRIAGPFQASPRVPASLSWSTTP